MKRLCLIILFISFVWGQTYTCQYDGNKLTKTFQSKFESGKTAYLWKCSPIGEHSFWIVEQASSQYQSEGLTGATIDNLLMQWSNKIDADERQREILEQQERIALAQMTPEQRKRYEEMKREQWRREAREEANKPRMNCIQASVFWIVGYSCIMIPLYYLLG